VNRYIRHLLCCWLLPVQRDLHRSSSVLCSF
jgi:hypothetical protein